MKKKDHDPFAEKLLKSLKSKEHQEALKTILYANNDYLYFRSNESGLFCRVETKSGKRTLGHFRDGEFVEVV